MGFIETTPINMLLSSEVMCYTNSRYYHLQSRLFLWENANHIMEIVQVAEGRKGKFDQWYVWDLESLANLIAVENCFDIMQQTPTICILTSSQIRNLESVLVERAQGLSDGG